MNLKKNYYIDIFLIFSIFVLDRVSKIYVIYLDEKNFNSEIFLSKFLNIQLIWNEGIAFGLLAFEKGSLLFLPFFSVKKSGRSINII